MTTFNLLYIKYSFTACYNLQYKYLLSRYDTNGKKNSIYVGIDTQSNNIE